MSTAMTQAIIDRVAEIQKVADQSRAEQEKTEALTQLTAWPDNASDEDMARMALLLQGNPMAAQAFDQAVLQKFSEEMNKLDPARTQSISEAARKIMETPRVQAETMAIEILALPPEKGATEWTITTFLVQTDENFKVGLPETLPQDICLSAYVSPRGKGLSAQFNIEAQEIKAGESVKPLTIRYTPDGNGQKFVHVNGHVAQGEQRQPVAMIHPFTVGPVKAAAPEGPKAAP